MPDLSRAEIKSMARAVGIDIQDPLLTEVSYNLNALRDLIEDLNPPGLQDVEPLPVIPPHQRSWHEQS